MQLQFPPYKFNTKSEQNTNYVFDIVRKKYVVLTPEEWVRQHVLHYLVENKNYPASLLAVERGLVVNGRRKRFDALTFMPSGKPYLLVECKSPDIPLTQNVFEQIAVYNSVFKAPYLWITNGLQHVYVGYSADFKQHAFLSECPEYL